MKELEHLKERLTRLSDIQKEQMKYFLGTEEAKDIGKILDCKDDVFMPRRMVDVTRDNVQNMTAQFEISDLEMTLTCEVTVVLLSSSRSGVRIIVEYIISSFCKTIVF